MEIKVKRLLWDKLSDGRYKGYPISGKEFMVVNYGTGGWRLYAFPMFGVDFTGTDRLFETAEEAKDHAQSLWDQFIRSQIEE